MKTHFYRLTDINEIMKREVIEKNKLGNGIYLGVVALLFLVFNVLAIFAWTLSIEINLRDKIIISFLALLSIVLLVYHTRIIWPKLISKNPEFELSATQFIINDNPTYKVIDLKEIEKMKVVKWHQCEFLGIGLIPSTIQKTNLKKNDTRSSKLPLDKLTWILLDLQFARIDSNELRRKLEKRIRAVNKCYE